MTSRLMLAALVSIVATPAAVAQIKDVDISTQVDSGIAQITFSTAYGKYNVRVPDEMAANDTFWGTAFIEANGDDSYVKAANEAALKQCHIEVKPVNGSPITIAPKTKPTPGRIPMGCDEVSISLCDPKHKLMHTIRRPCSTAPLAGYAENNQVAMPQVAQPKHNFRAGANNSGLPGAMLAMAASRFIPPIAGNNRAQWYRLPEDMRLGRIPLEVYFPQSGRMARGQMSVVQPKIYGPKLMRVGDTGTGRISLAGMGNMKGGSVIFRNLTPEVVSVKGGDYQVFPIVGR